jgi:hypothetical protein
MTVKNSESDALARLAGACCLVTMACCKKIKWVINRESEYDFSKHSRPRQPSPVVARTAGRTWRDQQMDVIGHEDIGVDAAAIALRAASANQYGIGRSRQTTVAP